MSSLTLTNEIVSVAIPLVSNGVIIGIAYGVLKSRLEGLVNEYKNRMEAFNNELMSIRRDVHRNEKKLEQQVGAAWCGQLRSDCHKNLCSDLKEIKDELVRLRAGKG